MKNEMWLIWKNEESRRRFKIGILTYDNNNYKFKYVDPELNDAKKNGFDFYPGFDEMNKEYVSNELFPNIDTRLPNVSRPDYLSILNSYNLDLSSSKFEILKATKGRLITDNFEFVPSFDKNKIEFDVAGTSHYDYQSYKELIKVNDNIILEPEPDNLYDRFAIKVMYQINNKNVKLGYVPRYYSKELTNLLNNHINYSAMVQKVNIDSSFDDDVSVFVKIIFE